MNSNVGSVFNDEQLFENDMNNFDLSFDLYNKESDNYLYGNFSFDDYLLST